MTKLEEDIQKEIELLHDHDAISIAAGIVARRYIEKAVKDSLQGHSYPEIIDLRLSRWLKENGIV
jgi:hypothetical protein